MHKTDGADAAWEFREQVAWNITAGIAVIIGSDIAVSNYKRRGWVDVSRLIVMNEVSLVHITKEGT